MDHVRSGLISFGNGTPIFLPANHNLLVQLALECGNHHRLKQDKCFGLGPQRFGHWKA